MICLCYYLGCGSPVSQPLVYAISAYIYGEADRGGLVRQRREFKTYRKSPAQATTYIYACYKSYYTRIRIRNG